MSKIIELKNSILYKIKDKLEEACLYDIYKSIEVNLLLNNIELEDKDISNYQYNIDFTLLVSLNSKYNESIKFSIVETILIFLNRSDYNYLFKINNYDIKVVNLTTNSYINSLPIQINWKTNLDLTGEQYN